MHIPSVSAPSPWVSLCFDWSVREEERKKPSVKHRTESPNISRHLVRRIGICLSSLQAVAAPGRDPEESPRCAMTVRIWGGGLAIITWKCWTHGYETLSEAFVGGEQLRWEVELQTRGQDAYAGLALKGS
jgi:hypothetical protein